MRSRKKKAFSRLNASLYLFLNLFMENNTTENLSLVSGMIQRRKKERKRKEGRKRKEKEIFNNSEYFGGKRLMTSAERNVDTKESKNDDL